MQQQQKLCKYLECSSEIEESRTFCNPSGKLPEYTCKFLHKQSILLAKVAEGHAMELEEEKKRVCALRCL